MKNKDQKSLESLYESILISENEDAFDSVSELPDEAPETYGLSSKDKLKEILSRTNLPPLESEEVINKILSEFGLGEDSVESDEDAEAAAASDEEAGDFGFSGGDQEEAY